MNKTIFNPNAANCFEADCSYIVQHLTKKDLFDEKSFMAWMCSTMPREFLENWWKMNAKCCYFIFFFFFSFFYEMIMDWECQLWIDRETLVQKSTNKHLMQRVSFYHYKFQGWTSKYFDILFFVCFLFPNIGFCILSVVFNAIILHISLNFIIVWEIPFSFYTFKWRCACVCLCLCSRSKNTAHKIYSFFYFFGIFVWVRFFPFCCSLP